jgi:hypothetical protein
LSWSKFLLKSENHGPDGPGEEPGDDGGGIVPGLQGRM